MPIATSFDGTSIFNNWERRYVFFSAPRKNASEPRMWRAPFDLVKVNGDEYIEPTYAVATPKGFIQDVREDELSILQAREDGFIHGTVVVEASQMGNGTDGWTGVHRFGNL